MVGYALPVELVELSVYASVAGMLSLASNTKKVKEWTKVRGEYTVRMFSKVVRTVL